MKNTKLFLLLAVAGALLFPALMPADTVVEEIIARVNNEIITRSEYARSRDQLKQEIQQQAPSNSDRAFAERQRDVLRDLIDQQLLLQKGKDMGVTGDTELIKRLDEMRKQMNLESMEDLEKAAQAQGISYEEFKQNTRNQIITQRVIGQEVGQHLALNKDDVKKFYDEHQAEMQQPEQIRLSEILVAPKAATPPAADAGSTPPAPTQAESDAQLAAAQAKAQDLLEQIRKGASFEDLAKKQSDGPSAAQGGDLNYFKRGTLAKELEDRVFALKAGETTDVIRTKQGFVILKVTEHQMAGAPTLKEVEPRIQDALYMQKLQPALRAYLSKLREEAFIDIKPGYIDSGASAKQTKPVETTARNATAKNLKKKKKLGVF
ncbi:MAG: peptidylprolyl isomerase [Acidobacteriales bacterium]|nr:peptidylprolyl isomerase [Candidatus Koribacter versatilis]MBI3644645.1 peptidylprolyl isomerase [Terriglobales bacterium]